MAAPSQFGKVLTKIQGFFFDTNGQDSDAVYLHDHSLVADVRGESNTDDAFILRLIHPTTSAGTTLFQVTRAGVAKVLGTALSTFSGAFSALTGTLSDVQHGVRTLANAHAHNDLSGLTTGDPHTQYETTAEVAAQVSTHAAAADPHTAYATNAEFDAHASRHNSGGADVLASDAAAATPSLRTLGTTSVKAAAGDHTTPAMSATVAGHVPTPPNNASTFLRGDATFSASHVMGAAIASAGAITPGTDGDAYHITGTTTITSIATRPSGAEVTLIFDGILTLTHNATNLILQNAANVTTAAGDVFTFVSEGSGNWREKSRRLATVAAAAAVVKAVGYAAVDTDESTTSTTYVDLATAGPSVTMTAELNDKMTFSFSGGHRGDTLGDQSHAAAKLDSDATSDTNSSLVRQPVASYTLQGAATGQFASLSAASHTVKVQYKTSANTCNFTRRHLQVLRST